MLNWNFESMKDRDEFFHNNSANGSLVRGLCSHVNRSSNDTNLDEMDEFALVLCVDWLLIKGTAFTYVLYMAVVSFQMRSRISIRGCVGPSVRLLVGPTVTHKWKLCLSAAFTKIDINEGLKQERITI